MSDHPRYEGRPLPKHNGSPQRYGVWDTRGERWVDGEDYPDLAIAMQRGVALTYAYKRAL